MLQAIIWPHVMQSYFSCNYMYVGLFNDAQII